MVTYWLLPQSYILVSLIAFVNVFCPLMNKNYAQFLVPVKSWLQVSTIIGFERMIGIPNLIKRYHSETFEIPNI